MWLPRMLVVAVKEDRKNDMRDTKITLKAEDDLHLILSALAAYRHNKRYLVLYEQLLQQGDQMRVANALPQRAG